MKFVLWFCPRLEGGDGYRFVNYWMSPLIRYLDFKHAATADLYFSANVIGADWLIEEIQRREEKGREKHRRHAAELMASRYGLAA